MGGVVVAAFIRDLILFYDDIFSVSVGECGLPREHTYEQITAHTRAQRRVEDISGDADANDVKFLLRYCTSLGTSPAECEAARRGKHNRPGQVAGTKHRVTPPCLTSVLVPSGGPRFTSPSSKLQTPPRLLLDTNFPGKAHHTTCAGCRQAAPLSASRHVASAGRQ